MTISDSTLFGNFAAYEGGGIYNGPCDGGVTAANTIVAGNTTYSGYNSVPNDDCNGCGTQSNYNLINYAQQLCRSVDWAAD